MTTHPAEVMNALASAFIAATRLVTDAERRGDTTGAHAWQIVIRAIENAEHAVSSARPVQTWRTMAGQNVTPRTDLPCFACEGIATEQHTCTGYIP